MDDNYGIKTLKHFYIIQICVIYKYVKYCRYIIEQTHKFWNVTEILKRNHWKIYQTKMKIWARE